MRRAIPQASERRICRVLRVPRSSVRTAPDEKRRRRHLDEALVERIRELIKHHPTFGYRKLWALLRYADGTVVNLKAVYRILKTKRWFCHQRQVTPRPRVQGRRSVAEQSNERWALALRPVFHHREDRIRAHAGLCWLALLLIRAVENATGESWRCVREELERLHLVTLESAEGRVVRRSRTTAGQRRIFKALELPEPTLFSDFEVATASD